jgi:hypothetical protein
MFVSKLLESKEETGKRNNLEQPDGVSLGCTLDFGMDEEADKMRSTITK